ncbi:hypothetical protein [Mucilaginibacter sp. UYCu711]|uniref:hypothetical protein n=1 Tax=Mucilaginibacter sp. UYCu711 TaxID=3156339 RepID=UPI003D21E5DE
MKTFKNLTFLLLVVLSMLTVSCKKSNVEPVTPIDNGINVEAPFTARFTKSEYIVNTNAGAKLTSDPIAAIQCTNPDALATGQYHGVTQLFMWLIQPVAASGWITTPLTSLTIDATDNNDPTKIVSRGSTIFTTNALIADSDVALNPQVIQPLGSTATTPLTANVSLRSYKRIPVTKTIKYIPENFDWNIKISQLDALSASSAAVHLTDYINVTGATFTGTDSAVSGEYFYPNKVVGNTYTITATKTYDNGTFVITKQITLH